MEITKEIDVDAALGYIDDDEKLIENIKWETKDGIFNDPLNKDYQNSIFFFAHSLCFIFSDFISNWISFKNWENNSMDQIGSTISGIYSMLLVCIYVAFAFTELVKYPNLDVYLERHGFFLFLFLVSNFYFIYIFICISRARK